MLSIPPKDLRLDVVPVCDHYAPRAASSNHGEIVDQMDAFDLNGIEAFFPEDLRELFPDPGRGVVQDRDGIWSGQAA